MLPKLNDEQIKFMQYLVEKTTSHDLKKIFRNVRYLKKKLFKNLGIETNTYIDFERLGLTNYFVLSKDKYDSPYLTRDYYCYLSSKYTLSLFSLPEMFQQKFVNYVESISDFPKIFKAKEFSKPNYNFRSFKYKFNEFWIWEYIKYYIFHEFPEIQEKKYTILDFNNEVLDILHYKTQKISKQEIFSKPGISKKKYYNIEKKLKNELFSDTFEITLIPKVLLILDSAENRSLIPNKLVSSFNELFIFCEAYKISEISNIKTPEIKNGLLCILSPPIDHIPLFIHSFLEVLDTKFRIYYLKKVRWLCNINQVYNSEDNTWIWNNELIKRSKF
ncbi:MAG: hypothetical protein ACTSRG_13375 [Candidatus Helarchaeota archaeon]